MRVNFLPLVMAGLLEAQTPTIGPFCSVDASGSRVCVRSQPGGGDCGRFRFPGGIISPPYACNDVMVEKTAPDGKVIFQRLLAGESDDRPYWLALDGQQNAVVIGLTYSRQFPVTENAHQKAYAGPAPYAPLTGYIPPGGDLFLSVVSPEGTLLHSTFLGSEGNEAEPLIHLEGGEEIDIAVRAGGESFGSGSARGTAGEPVLATFDLRTRKLIRSAYLSVGASYTYSMNEAGSLSLVTDSQYLQLDRLGLPLTDISLSGLRFAGVPMVTNGPNRDLWLTGTTKDDRGGLVARLTYSGDEIFRWKLPQGPSQYPFDAPLFAYTLLADDGLFYVTGWVASFRSLQFTTANALLRVPCAIGTVSFLAALDDAGQTRMLSYLPSPASYRLDRGETGGALLVPFVEDQPRVKVDFDTRPAIGCVLDAMRETVPPPFGAGQTVRLRGGRFDPALGGLRVLVGGQAVKILSGQPGELVFPIPFRATDDDRTPVVVEQGGQTSDIFHVPVRRVAPQILGPIYNPNGTENSFRQPAKWGSRLHLILTGAGRYAPDLEDGVIVPPGSQPQLAEPVSLSFQISGPNPEPGRIVSAAPVVGMVAGFTRIEFELPAARPYPYLSIVPLLKIGDRAGPLPSIYVE